MVKNDPGCKSKDAVCKLVGYESMTSNEILRSEQIDSSVKDNVWFVVS